MLGCQHGAPVPETSRTAQVHNVKVGLTDITPSEITVGVGDEVLFFNERTQPVQLILIEGGRSIACQRGFTGMVDQEAQLGPGQTASFCFERPGTFKYMARSKGVIEGAEAVLPGQVNVKSGASSPSQAKAQTPSQAGVSLTSAAMAVPETSRTATVHDMRVGLNNLSSTELSVEVGDEVRFINERADPIRIILIEAGKTIACKRGFTGSVDQEAEINPGESASFCFEKAGTTKYMVRSRPIGTAAGEKVLSGMIQIQEGSPVHSTKGGSMSTQSGTELTLSPKEER